MKKFLQGTALCVATMATLILIVDRIIATPGALSTGVFVVVVYALPISVLGCLVGEAVQQVLHKLKLKNTMARFGVFMIAGFGIGLIVKEVLLYEGDNMTIPVLSALGSVAFFVGRND